MQIPTIEMQRASRAHLPKRQDIYGLNKVREKTFFVASLEFILSIFPKKYFIWKISFGV